MIRLESRLTIFRKYSIVTVLQDAIREAQGIQPILVAMATHAGHAGVQEQACLALAEMTKCNTANQVQWFYC
jgi:hypothetical protein